MTGMGYWYFFEGHRPSPHFTERKVRAFLIIFEKLIENLIWRQ